MYTVLRKLFVAFPFFNIVTLIDRAFKLLLYILYILYVSSKFQNRALSSKLLTGISTLLALNIACKYENFTSLLKILLPLEAYQRVITTAQYRVYLFIQRLQT